MRVEQCVYGCSIHSKLIDTMHDRKYTTLLLYSRLLVTINMKCSHLTNMSTQAITIPNLLHYL